MEAWIMADRNADAADDVVEQVARAGVRGMIKRIDLMVNAALHVSRSRSLSRIASNLGSPPASKATITLETLGVTPAISAFTCSGLDPAGSV
jgi:hypothetical protein